MNKIQFLSIEEIFVIHEKMIEIGGGKPGICNIEMLHSAINRPMAMFAGKYLYKSIYQQAAALMQSLIKNHPFIDGNKRTAFFSTLRFLNINGINLNLSNKKIITFTIEVDTKNTSVEKIALLIQSYVY